MFKVLFFSLLLCFLSYNSFAQLKKISKPNLYSEVDLYQDDGGSLYSTVMRVQFSQKTIDLNKGKKTASFDEVLVNEVKTIFQEIKKRYGNFELVKEFPSSAWGDTIGVHIVTKEKVKLKDLSQFYELKFDKLVCVDSIKAYLMGNKYFKSVYGPVQAILTFEPDDYSSSEQWDLAKIEAPKAWDITRGSEDVRIGIADAWLSGNIPEDVHYELRGSKFAYMTSTVIAKGHGSQVAGVAGCLTHNNQGIASIGFNSKLFLAFVHPYWIDSLRHAGADIINISWFNPQGDQDDWDGAIYNCLASGVIVVAAVGNSQADNFTPLNWTIPHVVYPAAYNYIINGNQVQVIAVTATNNYYNNTETFGWPDDGDWNYSPSNDPINNPTNSFVDFAAPGVFIKVLNEYNNYGYSTASGTSLSAPMVAGLLGLIKSIYPALTPEIAYTILKNSSDKVGSNDYSYVNNTWSPKMGYGRINAYKALKYTVENYGGTFNQNVTIPAGDTWNIPAGKTLTFTSGAQLIVNGTLNAIGTSSSRIIFNRSGPSGTWGGIRFNSGSSGTLDYCDITYATNGIYLYNSSPTIKHSTIDYNSGIGIYCDYYSSPVLVGNNLRNNGTHGLRCNSYSSPNLTDYGYPGSNVIRDNEYWGINVTYNCNPNLNGYMTFGNSVFNNASCDVTASYQCTVNAQRVWWGQYPPNYYKFCEGESSTINWSNPLTSNPNPGRSVVPTPGDEISLITGVRLNKKDDDIDYALDKQRDKKYDEAIPLFLEVFKSNKDALVGKFALIKIEECFTQAGKKDFLEYSKKELRPLIKTSDETFVVMLELETHQLVNFGSYKEAMDNLFLIKEKYNLNEYIDKNTLYRIGVFYADLFGDKKNAQKYFDELKAKYPTDDLVNDIDRWLNATSGEPKSGGYIAVAQSGGDTSASEEASVSVENYPNPFNPTTRISFTIPEKSQIKLKVFDILGREVQVLAYGVYEAGKYEVEFNASNLPSGVYFYNLTTGSNTITKKMLLMK